MSVLEIPGQRSEGRSAGRVSVGRRVVATLEAARTTLHLDSILDEDLRRIRDGDLHVALRLVEHARGAAMSALAAGSNRRVRVSSVQQLLVELHEHWHDIQQDLLAQQVRMMPRIREALYRLRSAETLPGIMDRAAVEICRSCGVDRCVLMSMREGRLVAESVYFAQDPDGQEKWTAYALAHPPAIDPRDPEIELLRRHSAVLVPDNKVSRGVGDISRAAQSTGYVGAPVMVRGNVAGTVFADRTFSAQTVDTVARDVVGLFTEGLSYALERTLLLGHMRDQIGKIREMMAAADMRLDDMYAAGLSIRRDAVTGDIDIVGRGPVMPSDGAYQLMGILTRREIEVIDLMSQGASNAGIANELVVAESTVRSHVKHILRKLRAANRAQAVASYLRLQALAKN
ncbi:LuxR C-terminal-related transcriptional regulator [Kribbella sp. NPDC049174]|uniref:helix-turn-helix domain-containing protein n=1 Tax=Kribbella sp. NPDC049174 TaxID=3364112 RepID=UPI00371AA13C